MLLASERWRSLGPFVERWYAHPLSDEDGHTPLEIECVVRRLGAPLPIALAEWFELVGKRLLFIQDKPTPLDQLRIENGVLCVWRENQGVWSVHVPLDGDDPATLVAGDASSSPEAPSSRTLLGLLVSDTLVGAWVGHRTGILGDLRASVRGGYHDAASDEAVARLHAAYPALGYVPNPTFDVPLRGTDDTIIRSYDVAIEWMTATEEAFDALDDVLDLDPEDGEHEVTLAFESLTTAEYAAFVNHREPTIHRAMTVVNDALVGIGRVGSAVDSDAPRLDIRTRQPHRVLELLLAMIPRALHARVTITTRPAAIAVVEVLFPSSGERVRP